MILIHNILVRIFIPLTGTESKIRGCDNFLYYTPQSPIMHTFYELFYAHVFAIQNRSFYAELKKCIKRFGFRDFNIMLYIPTDSANGHNFSKLHKRSLRCTEELEEGLFESSVSKTFLFKFFSPTIFKTLQN